VDGGESATRIERRVAPTMPMITTGMPSAATTSAPVRAKALDVRAHAKQPVRHLRAPNPIHFPVGAEVPEGFAHVHIRTFLFQLLDFVLGDAHTVGFERLRPISTRPRRPSRSSAWPASSTGR